MQDENENLMDMSENKTSNPRIAEGVRTIGDIIDARLSRRSVLAGAAATAALTLAGCGRGDEPTAETEALGAAHHTGEVSFSEITRGVDGVRASDTSTTRCCVGGVDARRIKRTTENNRKQQQQQQT